ncbi:MAG: hypothetical protein KDH09_18550 [Chrysiogenetes bacterium]|nr:hypothetical protein [Chrysiogenetes bacterium]
MKQSQKISYKIDGLDRIVETGGDWEAFAQANGGAHLGKKLLGTSLWSHIQCVDLITLYRPLLKHVRETGEAIRFPSQCNSPELIREGEMQLSPLPDGGIEFRVLIHSESPRKKSTQVCPQFQAIRGVMDMCDWCLNVRLRGEGLWDSTVEAVRKQGLLACECVPDLRRVICPECKGSIERVPH